MTIQIPWNKPYTMEYLIFKFVPKMVNIVNEEGMIRKEKNSDAKFKMLFK